MPGEEVATVAIAPAQACLAFGMILIPDDIVHAEGWGMVMARHLVQVQGLMDPRETALVAERWDWRSMPCSGRQTATL